MSKKRTAANGQEPAEEMIGRWRDARERGEFPEGERTVGGVAGGVPPLSSEAPATAPAGLIPGNRASSSAGRAGRRR